jgi:hypothetical protein
MLRSNAINGDNAMVLKAVLVLFSILFPRRKLATVNGIYTYQIKQYSLHTKDNGAWYSMPKLGSTQNGHDAAVSPESGARMCTKHSVHIG